MDDETKPVWSPEDGWHEDALSEDDLLHELNDIGLALRVQALRGPDHQ